MYLAARKLIGTIVLATLAGGCMAAEPGETMVRRQQIQGGSVDSTHTSVVGILINIGPNAQAICSGTLIAPNLVLTARHCVAELTSEFVECGNSPFGAVYSPNSFGVTTETNFPESGYRQVSAVHIPPGTNDTCGFDIALLELTQNITTTEPIVPRIDVPIVRDEVYTAVGYGHTGNGAGAGTRRQLGAREVLCGTGTCGIQNGIEGSEFAGTDGTCQGDSGGAALDAQGRVLGALSRGPEGCAGSVYSAVDAWAGWLREIGAEAATNGGYAPAPWVELGISEVPANDPDLDGILDPADNCPQASNVDQLDLDSDGVGDECDPDLDGDGRDNDVDNCPLFTNPEQLDNDNDLFGDACDQDDDNDGVMDPQDNCQFMANATQADVCYGNTSFDPVPGNNQEEFAANGEPIVIVTQQRASISAKGRACAGSLRAEEAAFFLMFLPLLRTRRMMRRYGDRRR